MFLKSSEIKGSIAADGFEGMIVFKGCDLNSVLNHYWI